MNEDLDTRQLRAFVALVREGSFTGAARSLGLTQSAVSHSMRLLQEDLGCSLLYKAGRKVHLTRQGEQLVTMAEKVFFELNRIRTSLRELDHVDRGVLRIGCTTSASRFILPGVLREFHECFPDYTISVHPGDTPGLVEQLEQNRMDLVIALKPPNATMLRVNPIFRDELCFLINPMHPWAKLKRVPTKSLGEQTYILDPRGSLTFDLVEEYFLNQALRFRSVIELGSIEAIKELVKLGVGVGITAGWVAAAEVASGSILERPILPKIRREWAVLSLKNRPLSLAEQTFVGLCEAVGANRPNINTGG